ncbi:LuxR family transcriptional regulator [Actinokineospora globicatena]|uniref:LuxR family transcriptional regulator n=1 Tax=Actinokineospora globicatena TaxID=103729 RepID=A0A9W6QJ55_9PSEU|nr:LuxR family transcriptional regulator [Actinokineospora globicatena]
MARHRRCIAWWGTARYRAVVTTLPPVRLPTSLFVGRSTELAELAGCVRRPPAVALLEGEAGVGKTRLVRELLRLPQIAARTVLVGACQPMRTPLPYGPVVDILRETGDLLAGVADRLPPVTGALRPLLPELAPLLPPELERGDAAVERHRVFRAVRELLAAYGPILLVVEDLHWADEGTQDLLRFITSPPPPELSAVFSYRKEEGAALPGSGYRLLADARNSLLRLRPLEPGPVAALAADLLGTAEVPEDFALALHHRTAGIPFVIEEVLREVRETGDTTAPRPTVLDLVDIPDLLRDTMSDRLARLGPTVSAVVHAAAVLDMPATEHEIGTVAGLPARRVGSALIRALGAAVLHETDTGRYALRHPLARQAAYICVPGPQRRRLHARAADLLAAAPDPPVVRLAHHHRRAGDLTNWVRKTLAAVDQATEVGDTALALHLLEDALVDDALPSRARNTLAVRLSRVALNAIAHSSTIERLGALLRDGTLGRTARGEVRLNLGRLLMNQAGRMELGQNEIEMAIHDLRDRPLLAARGMAALCVPSFGAHPVEFHLRWLGEALRVIEDARDQELVASVRANEVTALAQTGDPAMWAAVAELPVTARSSRVRRQLSRAYNNLADASAWLGHYGAAREYLGFGGSLLVDADVPFLSMLATGTGLRLDVAAGRWEGLPAAAAALIDEAGEMAYLAADAWLALAWLSLARDDRELAARHLDDALVAAPENAPVSLAVAAGRVAIALARGDVAAAAVGAERAVGEARHKGNWVWAADLVPLATRAFVRSGRIADAADLVAEYTDGIEGRDAPLAVAGAELARGVLASARGYHEEAVTHYAAAADHYAALPHLHAAASAREAAARSALDLGDTAAATRYLTAATTAFADLGATRDEARCRQIARRFRRGTPRGRKGYGDDLSPREREVVDLVAAGRTNRQIAQELYLSPRTVEHHVAKAMRKLGLTSRAAFEPNPT